MTCTTGMLQWVAINRVEVLQVRIQGKASKAGIPGESVKDCPTRMKRQMKYSIYNWEKSHKSLVLALVGDFNLPNVC